MLGYHIGKAGEYRVMSELLLRGWNPGQLAFDMGVDIILSNNTSIQVKTVSKSCGGFYTAAMGNSKYRQIAQSDFYIIWCVDEDCFYVIPKENIKDKQTIAVPSPRIVIKKNCQYRQFYERWDLLGEAND